MKKEISNATFYRRKRSIKGLCEGCGKLPPTENTLQCDLCRAKQKRQNDNRKNSIKQTEV